MDNELVKGGAFQRSSVPCIDGEIEEKEGQSIVVHAFVYQSTRLETIS